MDGLALDSLALDSLAPSSLAPSNIFSSNEEVKTGENNIVAEINKSKGEFYYLMNKGKKVLKFNSNYDVVKGYEITDIYDLDLLPFSCKRNIKYFNTWLSDRPIPTNQEHLNRVLDSLKLSSRNIMDLLKINNGFSLNDSYWIKPVASAETVNEFGSPNQLNVNMNWNIDMNWEDNNLYSNKFEESLGIVTFFGKVSSLGGTLRTPEITNQGSVGKAWRRIGNELILFKKVSEGASNLGKDHYSEVIASKVLALVEIDYVPYWLGTWHGKECSCCKIFTNENVGYLPMYQYLDGLGINRNDWDYNTLISLMPSEEDKQSLNDMLVFDFIIENWDRHFSNFGFLIDNDSQNIIKFAPIFDNGYSLMCRDLSCDFKYRDYDNYSNVNTFKLVTNKDVATYVINRNPSRYKRWAKMLMTHLDDLVVEECPCWYMNGVLDLIKSRCKYIQSL